MQVLTLAEVADKMGSGFESAIGALLLLLLPLWLSKWAWWLYGLMLPVQLFGTWELVTEMQSVFGSQVIMEVGHEYYVRCLASWNGPFIALAPMAIVRRRRHASRARRPHGACIVCGYDLRATPKSCPECGDRQVSPRNREEQSKTFDKHHADRQISGAGNE